MWRETHGTKLGDIIIRTRLLSSKLIGRETKDDKTLVSVSLVKLFKAVILGSETTTHQNTSQLLYWFQPTFIKGNDLPFGSSVDDQDNLAFQSRLHISYKYLFPYQMIHEKRVLTKSKSPLLPGSLAFKS